MVAARVDALIGPEAPKRPSLLISVISRSAQRLGRGRIKMPHDERSALFYLVASGTRAPARQAEKLKFINTLDMTKRYA